LPAAGSQRAVTIVEQDGEAIAALVHDSAVLNDPGLADSVALAARIALSNARLQADVRRRVAELEASRFRIVQAGDAQRRRLLEQLQASAGRRLSGARDILDLAVLEARVCADEASAERLATASNELAEAQADLEKLAAGIYPALLTEQGLGPALASLVERAPLTVRLVAPDERLPAVIETAVYFICAEALTNIAKHAQATKADIQVWPEENFVRVVVADDGAGGADPSLGSGLKGVADRIEALAGQLVVQSPKMGGTQLLVQIPAAPHVQEAPG
jgi:signal transduction histidine kinase